MSIVNPDWYFPAGGGFPGHATLRRPPIARPGAFREYVPRRKVAAVPWPGVYEACLAANGIGVTEDTP